MSSSPDPLSPSSLLPSSRPPEAEPLARILPFPVPGLSPSRPTTLAVISAHSFHLISALASVPPVITHGAVCPGQGHHWVHPPPPPSQNHRVWAGGREGRALSSVRHGKLPGPEDRDRNNPMAEVAVATVAVGWEGSRWRVCLPTRGGGWKRWAWRREQLGSAGRATSSPSWTEKSLGRAGVLGGSVGEQ